MKKKDPARSGGDAEETLLFVSLPDSFHHHVGDMEIDPEIPLPVEPDTDPSEWDSESLTWEGIVAGMLKVLARNPDHTHGDYYRRFVQEARPEIFTELSETGIIAARNENFAVAEEIFLALSGLDPDRVEGPANLAITYEQRADSLDRVGRDDDAAAVREQALEVYRDLLTREEIPVDLRLNAGMFLLKIYHYESAEAQLEQYIDEGEDEDKKAHAQRVLSEIRSRNLLDELFKEAYDFIKIGDEERGIERIRTFIEKNPEVWNAWFLLGWGLRRLRRFEDAAAAFQQALSLGADNADTLNELAICELELGLFDESRVHLEQALKVEPDNTKIMSNFGVLELRRDDPLEARRFFETVLELEPEDTVAREYLDIINGPRSD
ncbi:MAG: tetratricopeptide repeat protein [Spirochaeta sp.]|jgi:Flp pilus assembly protein TadD|nr:tetratricopeptide repeat protein [Spirochaeta sp.]